MVKRNDELQVCRLIWILTVRQGSEICDELQYGQIKDWACPLRQVRGEPYQRCPIPNVKVNIVFPKGQNLCALLIHLAQDSNFLGAGCLRKQSDYQCMCIHHRHRAVTKLQDLQSLT